MILLNSNEKKTMKNRNKMQIYDAGKNHLIQKIVANILEVRKTVFLKH